MQLNKKEELELYDLIVNWTADQAPDDLFLFGKSSESPTLSRINAHLGYTYHTRGDVDRKKSVGGVNFLRHLVISTHLQKKKLTYDERREIAEKGFGHSVLTQAGYNRQLIYE